MALDPAAVSAALRGVIDPNQQELAGIAGQRSRVFPVPDLPDGGSGAAVFLHCPESGRIFYKEPLSHPP